MCHVILSCVMLYCYMCHVILSSDMLYCHVSCYIVNIVMLYCHVSCVIVLLGLVTSTLASCRAQLSWLPLLSPFSESRDGSWTWIVFLVSTSTPSACTSTHPGPEPAPAYDCGLPHLLRAVPPRQLDGLHRGGEGQVRGQSEESTKYCYRYSYRYIDIQGVYINCHE